jgi:ABC-type oligopeptide transport system substrate-binding subunit
MPIASSRAGVAVVAALVIACSASRPPAILPAASPATQVLRVGIAALPSVTDPATAPVYGSGITRATYEPLLRLRPGSFETAPGAADRLDVSPDGLIYTFHIRSNARWSDDEAVTARDFVVAWRRVLDPRTDSPAGDVLAGVVKGAAAYEELDPVKDADRIAGFLDGLGLRAADDRTFIANLAQPAPWFRRAVTMPELAPVRLGADGSLQRFTNGPYRVASVSTSEIVLVPNQHYWAGRPKVDRLVLVPRGDAGSQIDVYRKGSFGAVNLDSAPAATARRDGGLGRELSEVPALQESWIQFNVHRAPFDNPKVRLAIAQSIDRGGLVHSVLGDAALPVTAPVPKGMPGYQPALKGQAYDPARCRTTLDSSGVSPADLQDVRLLVRDLPLDTAVAQYVADQVQSHLGIKLVLEIKPSIEVSKRLVTGDFQAQGPGGWIADYPDDQDWMDLFISGSVNGQWSRYSNPAYDRLVHSADEELDPGRRLQVYQQAQQLVVEEAPVAFLYQPLNAVLVHSWVSGLQASGMDNWPGDLNPAGISVAAH